MDEFDYIDGFLGGPVWKKKHDHDFFTDMFSSDEYQKRYLILTSTQLRYYHSKPYDLSDNRESELPLALITSIKYNQITESDAKNSFIFIVDIGVREFHFKVYDKSVVEAWIQNITVAKDFYVKKILGRTTPLTVDQNLSKVKFWKAKSPKAEKFNTRSPNGQRQPNSSTPSSYHIPYEPYNDEEVVLVLELEELIMSDKRIIRRLIAAVFDRLSLQTKKHAGDRSKQLGMALSMWLGLGDIQQSSSVASRLGVTPDRQANPNQHHNSSSSSSAPSNATRRPVSSNDVIRICMSVCLARELHQSCDTKKGARAAGGGDRHDDSKSKDPSLPGNITANGSMPRPIISDFEGQDIPFRADLAESLFILAFLRASLQVSGMLGQWLASIILTTAISPEHYIFANTVNPIYNPSQDPSRATSASVSSPNPSFSSSSAASSTLSTRNSLHLLNKASKTFAHPNDSIYFLIIRACSVIVQKIHAFKINMPQPIQIFTHVLKALTVGLDYQMWTIEARDPAAEDPRQSLKIMPYHNIFNHHNAATTASTAAEDHQDDDLMDRIFDQPDERVYLKCLSAVLFLRLICPAIISPKEWGALHHWAGRSSSLSSSSPAILNKQHHPQSTASSTSSASSTAKSSLPTLSTATDRFTPGSPTAFMVLLALILGTKPSPDEMQASASDPHSGRNIRSNSFSSTHSTMASTPSTSVSKSTPRDMLDYFSATMPSPPGGHGHDVGGGGTSAVLYNKAQEIKAKLNQLCLTVEESTVTKQLEDYQTAITKLSDEDEDEIKQSGCDMDAMPVQLGLIEVAKVMQKVANMACMVESDMEAFIATDMQWQQKRSATAVSSTQKYPTLEQRDSSLSAPLSVDEAGQIFSQELTTVSKMLRKFYVDTSHYCDPSARMTPAVTRPGSKVIASRSLAERLAGP